MGRLASFKDSENRLTVERLRCTCLLRFSPCYKSGGGVNQRKRVGMTYLPTMEVKNVNRCFRHLLITDHTALCLFAPCTKFQVTTNIYGANSTKPLLPAGRFISRELKLKRNEFRCLFNYERVTN